MAHAPLLRVSALHALAYCERLFYLEEVEEIRIPDAAVSVVVRFTRLSTTRRVHPRNGPSRANGSV
jgi:hypothetical protein